jgi:hypothetical protein
MNFFKKLKISNALDSDKPWSAQSRQTITTSSELRAFCDRIEVLDSTLRDQVPHAAAPPELHRSIMRAVKSSRPAVRSHHPAVRWAALGACTALGIIILLLAIHRTPPSKSDPLAAASNALELRSEISEAAPAAVVSPLSDELERLQQNLDSTTQFLLAAVP